MYNMNSNNKEFKELLNYDKYLNKDLLKIIQGPKFDINVFNTRTLMEIRYVILLNYMNLYSYLENYLNLNPNYYINNLFNENSKKLSDHNFKYKKSTENYWENNYKFSSSINSSNHDYIFSDMYLYSEDIETIVQLLIKLIDIEVYILSRAKELSKYDLDYDTVIRPFLEKQVEIQIQNNEYKKKAEEGNYYAKVEYEPHLCFPIKKIKSYLPTKYKYTEAEDFYLAVSFSSTQKVLNKKEFKKLTALDYTISKTSLEYGPLFQNYMEHNLNSQLREHKSVIASVVFAAPVVYDLTVSFLDCKAHNPKGLDMFQALYVEHIFIIKRNIGLGPKFFRKEYYISGKKHQIYVNFLSLEDLSVLYSTIDHLNSFKGIKSKKNKFRPEELIYLSRDLKIDSDVLNSYFYNLIDLKRSIFLFNGYTWSEILKSFFKYGIEISGGSTTKRHLLSPKDITLASFMSVLQSLTPKKVIISNYLIDEKIYKSQFNKVESLSYNKNRWTNIILKDLVNLTNESLIILNNTLFSLNKLDTQPFSEDYYKLFNFILNFFIVRLDNDYKLNKIPYSAPFFTEILISFFKDKLSSIKLKSKKNVNLNNQESLILPWVNNIKLLKANKKFFSTSARINVSNLKIEDKPLANQPNFLNTNKEDINITETKHLDLVEKSQLLVLKKSNEKVSSSLSSNDILYNSLLEIMKLAETKPEEAQIQIEENWIDIMSKAFLNKNDKLVLSSKLKYIFDEALKSFNTKEYQRRLKKGYLDLYNNLIDPSLLLLSLFILIDCYTNSSQTMLGHILGKNILIKIFIKNSNKNTKLSFYQFLIIIIYKKSVNFNSIFNDSEDTNNLIKEIEQEEIEGKYEDIKNKINEYYVKLGLMFMSIFYTAPVSLFNLDYRIKGIPSSLTDMNKPLNLFLSDEYKDWALSFKKNAVFQPKNIPMVCKPNKWTTLDFGGYLINKKLKEDVITGSIAYHGHKLIDVGKVKLLKTINYFNSIKFGINNSLLNYLKNEGNFLLNDLELDELNNSKISLRLADLYKEIPFYITTHADWRGRIYTNCFYLSYQGSEMATALLQFWEGFTINAEGLNSLCEYGATLYSDQLSKENSESKKIWLENNKLNILLMDPDFIKKADSPLLFAAFCLEMKKLEKDSKAKIHFPIFIDATCSGIQHLSAMVLDSELASLVNLTLNNKNKPEDIYNTLVEPINKAINDFGAKNTEFSALKDIYLDRKILKRPIMTQNYNVSIFGMKEQLAESLNVIKEKELNSLDSIGEVNTPFTNKLEKINVKIGRTKDGKEIILNNKDLFKISMIIKEVIFLQYPVLKDIYDYFIATAKLMESLNLPVQWITPTGAIITQDYKKSSKKRIRALYNKKYQTKVLKVWSNEIDFKKQKDGIIPNVIHSLDSSHIINLIIDKPKSYDSPIVTVHDCFGTHPNYINILQFRLKEEFISLYSNNKFLKLFQKRLNQYILDNNFDIIKDNKNQFVILNKSNGTGIEKLKIPVPPIKNNFDINNIKYSKYMFS